MSDRLLDAEDVAALLNVPKSWVYESARTGAIPHVKLGKYTRFREPEVLAWVESCSQPGRSVALRVDRGRP